MDSPGQKRLRPLLAELRHPVHARPASSPPHRHPMAPRIQDLDLECVVLVWIRRDKSGFGRFLQSCVIQFTPDQPLLRLIGTPWHREFKISILNALCLYGFAGTKAASAASCRVASSSSRPTSLFSAS